MNSNSNSNSRDMGRTMPHSIEAEQGVLGGMLLSQDAVADVSEILVAEDFYRPGHQRIFEVITELFSSHREPDALLVAEILDKRGILAHMGGADYIFTMINKVQTTANVGYYAEIVKEKSTLRRLVQAGTKIVQDAYTGAEGIEIEELIDRAQQQVFGISNEVVREDYESFQELVDPTMDALELLSSTDSDDNKGIKTGFYQLDEMIHGLRGGQMIIVAARPGVGKSTLAMDFIRSCAIKQGKTAALFSLEMSKEEVMMRIFSAEAEIALSKMRGGSMDQGDWDKLTQRLDHIAKAPIFIDDSPNLTMMEIRSKSRRLKQQYDLSLIVVDYLQLMSSGKRVESRQQEVSEFSRQLKLLAKECDVPLVAISQLNRGVESRGEDALPRVSDLRESGSLEQDADMVMLINRPDAQNRDHERAGEADIILAKHRGGPIGTVTVANQLHYSKFANPAFSSQELT